MLSHLVLDGTISKCYNYPHFGDENTEGQVIFSMLNTE